MPDQVSPSRSHGLVEILDRVLDKGLVIAGDIKINLANVELLTIQVRLLVCSIDKAQEIGLDWWKRDSFLSASAAEDEAAALKARVEDLERRVLGEAEGDRPSGGPPRSAPPSRRRQPGSRR